MRFHLAIVMTVAFLVGPWLCCCGPMRVANAKPLPESQPAHQHCPKCPVDEPSDDDPPQVPERCPCGGLFAGIPADKPSIPTVDALLIVVAVEPTQAIPLVDVAPTMVFGLRELPFLTISERLYAHHVLRC